MNYESPVLWQKMIPNIIKALDNIKATDREFNNCEIAFQVNGGKKKVKLKIILE